MKKDFCKNFLRGSVERPVSGIRMVLWAVRLQERRQVCQVRMGTIRYKCGCHYGDKGGNDGNRSR